MPLLKSGKKTRYKYLPFTIIIFITQDDIFGQDLDRIVTEVKRSEEWEAVQMSILEIGISKEREQGILQGIAQGIQALIESCQEFSISQTDTLANFAKIKSSWHNCS